MGCSASTTVPAVDEEIHLSKVLHDRAEFEKERAHRYRLSEETLGQGAFGVVYAAVSENSKLSRAIKILPITSSKGHGAGPDEELLDEAKKEVAVWAEAGSHPNIVELLRSYVEAGKYCMVMDRCDGGSLGDRKTAFMSYPDHEVARVFREMLFGISHIHSRNIIHRDIKPSNFLFGGPRSQTVKLADFGLATTEENGGLLWGCYGTPPYMSPEMAAKRGHHRSTDIWSLGASCYLLLFGEYPYLPVDVSEGKSKAFKDCIVRGWPAPSYHRRTLGGRRGQIWWTVSSDFPTSSSSSSPRTSRTNSEAVPQPSPSSKEFVQHLLQRDSRRVTADQALDHTFLTDTDMELDVSCDEGDRGTISTATGGDRCTLSTTTVGGSMMQI